MNDVIEILGNESGTDPLDSMLARLAAADDRRVFRLDRNRLEVRVLPLEVAGHTGDRAAGPDSGDDRVNVLRPLSSQISGPVVASCMAGLAGFSNC